MRDAVERIAKPHGLERKCIKIFEMEIGRGLHEYLAAMQALAEYDLLEIVEDD